MANDNDRHSHLFPQAEAYIRQRFGFFDPHPRSCMLSTRFLITNSLWFVERGISTLEEEETYIQKCLDVHEVYLNSLKNLSN